MTERKFFRQFQSPQITQNTPDISAGVNAVFNDVLGNIQQAQRDAAEREGERLGFEDPTAEVKSGITQNSRARAKAFNQASFAVLSKNALLDMSNLAENLSSPKNISSSSAVEFSELSNEIKSGVIDSAPEAIRSQLKFNLDMFQKSSLSDVNKKTLAHIENQMLSQSNDAIDTFTRKATTSIIDGDIDGGLVSFGNAANVVNSALEGGLISPEQARKTLESIDIQRHSSLARRDILNAIESGSVAEVMADFVTNPPANLDDTQRQAVASAMLQELKSYNTMVSEKRQLESMDISMDIQAGMFSSLGQLNDALDGTILSETQKKTLQQSYVKTLNASQSQNQKTRRIFDLVSQGDRLSLMQESDSDISKAYNTYMESYQQQKTQELINLGQIDEGEQAPLSILDYTIVAKEFGVPNKVLSSRLENISLIGSLEEKSEAAIAYNSVRNSPIVGNLNSDADAFYSSVISFANTNPQGDIVGVEKAVEMTERLFNVSDAVRKERAEAYKNEVPKKYTDKVKAASKSLGIKQDRMPEGLITEFWNLTESLYPLHGTMKGAMDNASARLNTIYGDSPANPGQVMYLPPDKVIPGYENNPELARNDMFLSALSGLKESFPGSDIRIPYTNAELSSASGLTRVSRSLSSMDKLKQSIVELTGSAEDSILSGESLEQAASRLGVDIDFMTNAYNKITDNVVENVRGEPVGFGVRQLRFDRNSNLDIATLSQFSIDEFMTQSLVKGNNPIVFFKDGIEYELDIVPTFELTANPSDPSQISYAFVARNNELGEFINITNSNGESMIWTPSNVSEINNRYQNSDIYKMYQEEERERVRKSLEAEERAKLPPGSQLFFQAAALGIGMYESVFGGE